MRLSLVLAAALFALPAAADPNAWEREWPRTDFSKTTLDGWSEIQRGIPKDMPWPAPRFAILPAIWT